VATILLACVFELLVTSREVNNISELLRLCHDTFSLLQQIVDGTLPPQNSMN
jgi:hypothetical protein